MTSFSDGVFQYGGMPVTPGVPVPFNGNAYFVDPVNGSDGNRGSSPKRAFSSLYRAHKACLSGNNDVVYLIGNGSTTGTARLSKAAAQLSDSTATSGALLWTKNSTHLIGITAPSNNTRARIAPGTADTQALFGSGNLVVVSGSGCYFSNFSVSHEFATGGTSQIAWTDSGGRNSYQGVDILGKLDATSAADTASLSLLISGGNGENLFSGCRIGADTIKGAAGCYELSITGGSPRNSFVKSIISAYAGGTTSAWVSIPASGIDRWVLFDDCLFVNPVLPASGAAASV